MSPAPTPTASAERLRAAPHSALRRPLLVLGGLLLLALWVVVLGLLARERDELLRAEAQRNENLALAHEQQLAASLHLIEDRLDRLRQDIARDAQGVDLAQVVGAREGLARYIVSVAVLDGRGDALR